jgi:hypothetical protein
MCALDIADVESSLMSKRRGLSFVLSLAVLFLAPAVLGQGAERKMPLRSGYCEPGTCINKVLYLPDFSESYELQSVADTLRVILEVNHVDPNQSEHAISLQGTTEQIAIGEKLVNVLESLKLSGGHNRSSILVYEPTGSLPEPAVSEMAPEQARVPSSKARCELTTCFTKALYLPDFSIVQLSDALKRLHSTAQIARISLIPSSHAIVFQGNSKQVALAERLLSE